MTLSVIGAGVGRTGTMSLKKALSNILGGDCYHMVEIFPRPEHIPVWHAAAKGKIPNWGDFLRDFKAAVDWPASAFWEELAGAYPNAIIVLSYRDPEEWWQSASETIFPALVDAEDTPWRRMIFEVLKQRFTAEIESKEKGEREELLVKRAEEQRKLKAKKNRERIKALDARGEKTAAMIGMDEEDEENDDDDDDDDWDEDDEDED